MRVVASVEDPNPLVKGRGFAFLREHGIDLEIGRGADRAILLNQPFFTRMRQGRPFVIAKIEDQQAVANLDRPIIIGVVLLGGFFIVIANIVVDIIYVLLAPRVR